MMKLASSLLLSLLLSFFAFGQGPTPAAKPVGDTPPPEAEQGGGNLSILPVRLVLEGRTRSEEVMLRNTGKGKATYRIMFKEMAMTQNGDIEECPKKEGQTTAADLIRFSPRQVELAPGESQIIRIQVRKPEGLPDGEYRSHLLFQSVPDAKPPAPLQGDTDRALSVKLNTVLGISIPVILRHGDVHGKVTLTDLRFWQPDQKVAPGAPPVLSLHLVRDGNRSLSGDISAVVESGGRLKRGTVLWETKGNVIYTDIPWRHVHLPMYMGKTGELNGARVKVTFTPTDFKGAPVVAYLDIPA
jgi:hypothetical protein